MCNENIESHAHHHHASDKTLWNDCVCTNNMHMHLDRKKSREWESAEKTTLNRWCVWMGFQRQFISFGHLCSVPIDGTVLLLSFCVVSGFCTCFRFVCFSFITGYYSRWLHVCVCVCLSMCCCLYAKERFWTKTNKNSNECTKIQFVIFQENSSKVHSTTTTKTNLFKQIS